MGIFSYQCPDPGASGWDYRFYRGERSGDFLQGVRVEKECVSTSCTILIAVVGFMILYHIAKPMTTPHAI